MPAKPAWYPKLERILAELESDPRPYVDRATLESLLGVGRRRAQQILNPCVTDRVGASGLADRRLVMDHLRHIAGGDEAYYERRRRERFAATLERLHRDRLEKPQLLVEAPRRIVKLGLENLPEGVRVENGRITVEFGDPRQALEKLLALAMAIGNDYERFERSARK